MANYQALKERVSQAIKTNGSGEITGQVLQDAMKDVIDTLGANYMFAGIAVPSTIPITTDARVFYVASEGGTYESFGGIVVPNGISFLTYDSSWTLYTLLTLDEIDNGSADKGVFPSYTALSTAYPTPKVGWHAAVGTSTYILYNCLVNGVWNNTNQEVNVAGIKGDKGDGVDVNVENEVLIFTET